MFVAIESFLSTVIDEYGKRFIPTENCGTWYSQSCKFFKLDIIYIFLYTKMRNALLREQCSVLGIEHNVTIITFHAERKIVSYVMYYND